jgi:RimJ/RimL family protein N-acetyltransferase/8-oxo-dGTP pyrophosphatase MutT (NUDIX family)
MAVEDGPPTLTDGVVTLRAWEDEDVDAAIAGQDEEIAHWFGFSTAKPTREQQQDAVRQWRRDYTDGRRRVSFVVEAEGRPAGTVEVRDIGQSTGELSWALYAGHRGHGYATRAIRLLAEYAFSELGLSRLQARVEPDNVRAIRLARRSGFRNEGVLRVARGTGGRAEAEQYVLLARLRDDPPPGDRAGFRALLNSFLPLKRTIAQNLIRDPEGRVLLCHPAYKDDWDLPGGVIERMESPRAAAGREVLEELGLEVTVGPLLLADWLPPWGGWDDALCLVFDGGVYHSSLLDAAVYQATEVREARFCGAEEVRRLAADYTARRVEAALAALAGQGPVYTESGHPG